MCQRQSGSTSAATGKEILVPLRIYISISHELDQQSLPASAQAKYRTCPLGQEETAVPFCVDLHISLSQVPRASFSVVIYRKVGNPLEDLHRLSLPHQSVYALATGKVQVQGAVYRAWKVSQPTYCSTECLLPLAIHTTSFTKDSEVFLEIQLNGR